MHSIRARDFIDWNALEGAYVNDFPYLYCEVDLIKPEFCELVYDELKPVFYDNYDPTVHDRDGAFPVHATGDINYSYAGDLVDTLNTWEHWNDWFKEKFNDDLGLCDGGWPRFGYQGANHNNNFMPHTDEYQITDVWAKGLIYIHDSVGTKMYASKKISHSVYVDEDGKETHNPIEEPYYEVTDEVRESVGVGKMVLFKCKPTSFNGTDFSSLNEHSKRIILAGSFK